MKQIWLVGLAVFLVALAVRGQQTGTTPQHAPTAEQCQADANVWGNRDEANDYLNAEGTRAELGTPDETIINHLPVTEVRDRALEMANCSYVDPHNTKQYSDVGEFYLVVQENREHSFLERHNLWNQFLAEDAGGLR